MKKFRGFVAVLAAFVVVPVGFAQKPAAKSYRVVTPKDDRLSAVDLNANGEIIGTEWVEDEKTPDIIGEVPFLAKGKRLIGIPLLKGYTSTFPAAVSDGGLVVGRASKPGSLNERVFLRNQAFLWDEKNNGIRGLGALEGDVASFATGISRDGTRISGVSLGDQRMRACVWERQGNRWVGTPMPHEGQLTSNVVAISGDGRLVSAADAGVPCVWSKDASGKWVREAIGSFGALIPRAVNNAGTVVGYVLLGNGRKRAVVYEKGKGCKQLPLPADFTESEAIDVNNDGVVVGGLERLTDKGKEPAPFVVVNGKLSLIEAGGPNFISATAINDNWQITGTFERDDEEVK